MRNTFLREFLNMEYELWMYTKNMVIRMKEEDDFDYVTYNLENSYKHTVLLIENISLIK